MARQAISTRRRAWGFRLSSSSVTRTKSPCLKACAIAKNEAAAQNQATTSFTAPVATSNRRSTLWPTISTAMRSTKTAPTAPDARYRRSRKRRKRFALLLVEGVDQRGAVRAGLLLPVGLHDAAHLLQVRH